MRRWLTLNNSIATQLLKVIFGCYLLVAIVVTIIQMVFEYRYVRDQVFADIQDIQKSYGPSIASALWTFNATQIQAILVGINEIPSISGVTIEDGEQKTNIGIVNNDDGKQEVYDKNNVKLETLAPNSPLSELIDYSFPIIYVNNDKENNLGKTTIYSSTNFIIKQVKYGFILIIINSVIKTIALWFIFLYFVRKILSRPITQLTSATQKINLDNLDDTKINIAAKGDNELKVLEHAFNEMLDKLFAAKKELELINKNLENTVKQRTQELQAEVTTRIKAQKHAEAANATKSMFLANMSHEIRTPMTSIIGMAKILDHMELDNDKKHKLEIIVRNSDYLLNIINDILDYSKVEADLFELEMKEFSLHNCVANVIDLLSIQSNEKNITLNYEIDEKVPVMIVGDATRLSQVLTNLVGNAIKFTHNGNVNINIKTHNNGKQLLFSAHDTGIGFSKEQASHLFDAFTQADSSTSRQYGGTGLGLAICKRFVELMGGTIWAESHLGIGSSFYFTINCFTQEDTNSGATIDKAG